MIATQSVFQDGLKKKMCHLQFVALMFKVSKCSNV